MASSRKSKPADPVCAGLLERVAGNLKRAAPAGRRLLLGLSGGIDSVVLLDVLCRLAPRLRFDLAALHVNHQIHPDAAKWATFCRRLCRARGVPLRVARVTVARGNSIEGAARDARRAEFLKRPADFIVLAHHADDQVETVMLQMLRGTGVKGLAGMPMMREANDQKAGAIVRPMIDVPRSEIERYAGDRKLEWIEDPSNTDSYYLRNFLRHEILPRIAARVPGYRSSLTRASRHAAEAVQLIDELAALDAGPPAQGATLSVARLACLSGVRAKNVLRWFLSRNGVDIPAADRLEEALRQVLTARDDARVCVSLGETALRRYAGVLHLVAESRAATAGQVAWSGQTEIVMPGGVLKMRQDRGAGISLALLDGAGLIVRDRQRGERLQPDRRRPRRSLKNLFQESGLPPWQRDALPYLYCGDRLVCVPGVGVDCEFQALLDEPSVFPVWLPFRAGPSKTP